MTQNLKRDLLKTNILTELTRIRRKELLHCLSIACKVEMSKIAYKIGGENMYFSFQFFLRTQIQRRENNYWGKNSMSSAVALIPKIRDLRNGQISRRVSLKIKK